MKGHLQKKLYFYLDHIEKFGCCMVISIKHVAFFDVANFWPFLLYLPFPRNTHFGDLDWLSSLVSQNSFRLSVPLFSSLQSPRDGEFSDGDSFVHRVPLETSPKGPWPSDVSRFLCMLTDKRTRMSTEIRADNPCASAHSWSGAMTHLRMRNHQFR